MPPLYDEITAFFKGQGLVFVDDFIPYFIASTGCHLLNLWNKSDEGGHPRRFCTEGGRVRDLRLHLLMVAPPGGCKTLFINTFLNREFGVFNPVRCSLPADTTYPGMVGTVESNGVIRRGSFGRYQSGILGYDEFDCISTASQSDHSKATMNALLRLLDSGHYHRDMRGGELAYQTYSTLWGGVQHVRQKLDSGVGRRLFFILFSPRKQDFELLKKARRDNRNRLLDVDKRNEIRDRYRDLYQDQLGGLREVIFPDDFNGLLDELDIKFYEEDLFERLAIGYSVMRHYDGGPVLNVTVDSNLKWLMLRAVSQRKSVNRHPLGSLVYQILTDNGHEMALTKLCNEIVDVTQMRYGDVTVLVKEMLRDDLLHSTFQRQAHSARPIRMITFNEDLLGEM